MRIKMSENGNEVLEWDWNGMGMGMISRKWQEMGTTIVIPAHLYCFLCLSDRLMLLLYTVTLSLCLLLKLYDDDDDNDDLHLRDSPTMTSCLLSHCLFSVLVWLWICDVCCTLASPLYSSCKEIRDSNSSSTNASGEYTIRTVSGRILDKVRCQKLIETSYQENCRLFNIPISSVSQLSYYNWLSMCLDWNKGSLLLLNVTYSLWLNFACRLSCKKWL